ncbi:group II intron maturase-specific domain-containing protein [Bradyrhizobium sp. LA2.1]|uniref:group II intron maturase-specific domain-containing protein n=1 Tax=Bradyrhizobium sp. LA2.1 TaxID=3156376 RepID=UPI00339AF57B
MRSRCCARSASAGWAAFYKFTDFTAHVFRRIDHVVFWKMAHWLGHKYRFSHQTFDAEMVPTPGTGQGENLARVWSK